MKIRILGIFIAGIVILACMAGIAIAGRAKVMSAYGYPTVVHQYQFQPNKVIVKASNPAAQSMPGAPLPATGDKRGIQAWPQVGNRHIYRASFSIEKNPTTPNVNVKNKLGQWPVSLYNQNSGKGKELSSIFK